LAGLLVFTGIMWSIGTIGFENSPTEGQRRGGRAGRQVARFFIAIGIAAAAIALVLLLLGLVF
jgi:hypothetical protein